MYIHTHIYIYIYICIHINKEMKVSLGGRRASRPSSPRPAPGGFWAHPVSITRFPLRRFSPGAGLLRNPFVHRQWLRFSRGIF